MAKDKSIEVRSHSQEREWLLNLGNGDIVDGVKYLIDHAREEQADNNFAIKGKVEKTGQTGLLAGERR